MKSRILSLAAGLIASVPLFLSSCQDEDYGYTSEQIAYRTNFEKKFGKIKDIQTFDMSSYNLNRLGLQGGPKYSGQTRAAGDVFSVITGDSRWFQVPSKLGQWMDVNLKENRNNKNQGTTQFKLFMPDHDILIIPVYQGEAGMEWELYLSDEDNEIEDTKIWSKSELMQVSGGDINWSNTQVGEAKTTTLSSDNPLSFQTIQHGGNSHNSLLLRNAVPAEFDPSKEWLQITMSGFNITNGGSNGSLYIGNTDIGQINYGDFSKTIDIKDAAKLQTIKTDENFCFSMWYSEPAFTAENNKDISVTVKRFSYSYGNNWENVSDLGTGNVANTIGKNTRSQAIRISHDAFSGIFSLYLKVTNRNETFWSDKKWGDFYASKEKMSSKDGQMVILNVLNDPTIGAELKQSLINAFGDQQMYRNICMLGCEDSDMTKNNEGWGSDWDMNDISFFVVGMPMENIVGKDDEIIKKRYMIEDLGSTFDFDFNDIVVDVTRIKSFSEDGTLVRWTETAELKHLCGTIPFQIGFVNSFGDKWFDIMPGQNDGGSGHTPTEAVYQDMLVSDNLTSGTTHYWDPDHNNIRVRVWPKAVGLEPDNRGESWTDEQTQWILSTGGNEFGFPDQDASPVVEIPYVIACDQTIAWQPELVTIPNDWFRAWHRDVEKKTCNISLDVRSLQIRPGTTSAEYTIDSNSTGDISISPVNNSGVTATLVGKKLTFTASSDAQPGTTATFTVSVAETSAISAGSATITVSVVDKLDPQLAVNNNAVTITANNHSDISYGSQSQGTVSVSMKDGSSSNVSVAIIDNNIRITVSAGATNGETATVVVSQVADGEYRAADNVEIVVTVQADSNSANVVTSGVTVQGEDILVTNDNLNQQMNNWGNAPEYTLPTIHEGDILIFEIISATNGQFGLKVGNSWNEFDPAIKGYNVSGNVAVNVTSAMLTTLSNNGNKVRVTGKEYTLKSIYVRHLSGCGPAPTYLLTVNVAAGCSGWGTVNGGNARYTANSQVEISATPTNTYGYKFLTWDDGETANPRSVTIGDADVTYSAVFAKTMIDISIGNTISPTFIYPEGSDGYDYKAMINKDDNVLKTAKAGDKLKFTVSNVATGGGTIVLTIPNGSDWSQKVGDAEGISIEASSIEVEIEIPSDFDMSKLIGNNGHGIAVQGQGFTLTKVELVKATTSEPDPEPDPTPGAIAAGSYITTSISGDKILFPGYSIAAGESYTVSIAFEFTEIFYSGFNIQINGIYVGHENFSSTTPTIQFNSEQTASIISSGGIQLVDLDGGKFVKATLTFVQN